MIKGMMNRYLHVDLGTGKFNFETPPDGLFEEFIGGKGVGLKVMMDQGLVTQDPYSPENPLIFTTGPFTGTRVQTGARSTLVTKSPLTGTCLDSHIGGSWGPQIKKAGLDYIYITGQCGKPSYLHITPETVSLEDASALWGKNKFEVEKLLLEKYPKAQVASIGTAGENLVKFACIGTDYNRQFGRGGSGAVMGSKNLKAIVISGDKKPDFFDDKAYKELTKQMTKDTMAHPNRALRYERGTPMWVRWGQETGRFLPINNCQQVTHDDYEKICAENLKKELNWKSKGCLGCAIMCAKVATWKDYKMEGPEYETVAWLGSNCGILDAQAVAYANYLADDFGLDTISAGATLAYAMEAFEKDIITSADTGGIDLSFGNADAVYRMLAKISARDGLGDTLAEGSRLASQKIGKGSEYFALQSGGMELSGVNIKGCSSMGLALATADFASHTRLWTATMEMNKELTFENVPKIVKDGQDEVNTRNSLVVCDFLPFGFDRLSELLNKMTGLDSTPESLQLLGEKITNMTRIYSFKNGRTRDDDTLPPRFFEEEHMSGIFEGKHLTREAWDQWLDELYKERGWDAKGAPTPETLERLGIQPV